MIVEKWNVDALVIALRGREKITGLPAEEVAEHIRLSDIMAPGGATVDGAAAIIAKAEDAALRIRKLNAIMVAAQ